MNLMSKTVLMGILCILLSVQHVHAQKIIAAKTNIPHWATVTPNLGVEVLFGDNLTLELSGGYNPFEFGNGQYWKHWVLWPELRYWAWEPFSGHFFGLHGVFAKFDVQGLTIPINKLAPLKERRCQGDFNGIGLSYGYAWIVGNNWLIEATVGGGYARVNYDVFSKGENGFKISEGQKHYFGPTKGAISLVYVF